MNPAQLIRSFAVCSLTLTITLISSCSTHAPAPAPPPPAMMAPASEAGTGNRSGGYVISKSSIDHLLSAGSTTRIEDRPGLGTSAGQERYSLLQTTRFIRKSDVPDAVDSFHYNDKAGAKAIVEILGGKASEHTGLFPVAGERVKVGLVRYGSIYPHYDAHGKRIVIGENGSHYAVRLENRSKKRLEIVLSVDGLNTLSGKAASPKQDGYVLDPKETYNVDGFRKDSSTVRSFLFGSVARSKAAGSGGASNVGVIGLAVFEEDEARVKAELLKEQQAREGANAFPGAR